MTHWEEFPPGDDIAASSGDWTHVLRWMPAYASGSHVGWWELRPLAGYVSGRQQEWSDAILGAPRDTPADALTRWAASKIGYPVMLVKSHSVLRCLWPPRRWRWQREPVYYIAPEVTP